MHNELLFLLMNRHIQKYERSCSPSLIEVMLKHYKLVDDGYTALQDRYKDENVGLTYFAGHTIEGLTIEKHDLSSGVSFVERLLAEWPKRQIIGLYCVTPNTVPPSCHGWIVSEILGDTIFLLSKYSESGAGEGKETVMLSLPLVGDNAIHITDLIFGHLRSEN